MWVAVIGGELSCKREPTNRADKFAVAVTKDSSQLPVVNSCHSGVGYGLQSMQL